MPIGRLKILIAGDESIGKTSLIRRFVSDSFSESYKATLGFEISVKNLRIDNIDMTLSLWDIGGQAAYAGLRKQYYQNGDGFLLGFCITNRQSYDNLVSWVNEIHAVCPKAPVILIATKADLPNHKVTKDEIEKKKVEIGAIATLITSAKTNDGVNTAFSMISQEVLKRTKSTK